eukprot:5300673-Alexandrium_andersonii.AAC.1
MSSEDYERALLDLLQESERIHGHTCDKIEHPNKYLTKYWYVKSKMPEENHIDFKATSKNEQAR